ncbi:helix-turn-helix domain-containing protein [Streptomyces yaizuensis]|uniref:Scr1 family TA system antitoxin-like transcriptional regulator n=1 Tax=Streptomyces yaizuensis TaxID=2989713 RepID=A0ABQ5P9S5_9ACTN|nr:helix-turn-helix transcriptional regulator [Streptomyces sp. YSPA8]GLF99327.1 Scr1 family TA system antitoxin-like transcriptional regulator [Streptomyces sp. YSPA8]
MNIKELNPNASPQAAFGARIRRLREERGWNQEELGVRMQYSGTQISHVETGRRMPTLQFARHADEAFGTGYRFNSFERQYREIKNGSLIEGFPEYIGLEGRAAEIRLFDTGLIPGPLQTHAYAASLEAANVRRGSITGEQAAERVEFVIDRQAALVRAVPPLMIVVLDESCIRRPIGGPGVMKEQLGRLIEFAQQPNTSLQVAPFTMGELRPFNRLVNLLTLADRSMVAYVESQTQGYLERGITSVLPLMRAYHQLQTEAPSQAESVAMISQIRKGTP